jgi:hypothetical protein
VRFNAVEMDKEVSMAKVSIFEGSNSRNHITLAFHKVFRDLKSNWLKIEKRN